jgi:outer membrane protein OmpA-like peptidoglycan-associated protein
MKLQLTLLFSFISCLLNVVVLGQMEQLTVNGDFKKLPKEHSAGDRAFSLPLNKVEGWQTLNTNKMFYESGHFPTNTARFYHSNRQNVSYASVIIGMEHMICKLRAKLLAGCEYEVIIKYKTTKEAEVGNRIGVMALTADVLGDTIADELLQRKPDAQFTVSRKSKKDWVIEVISFKAHGNEEYLLIGLSDVHKLLPGELMVSWVSMIAGSISCEQNVESADEPITDLTSEVVDDEEKKFYFNFDYKSGDSLPIGLTEEMCSQLKGLSVNSRLQISIVSKADTLGNAESNLLLSQRRAQYLKKVIETCLMDKYSLDILTNSLGESSASSDEAIHRRTEVFVTVVKE